MVLIFDGASLDSKRKKSNFRNKERWRKWKKGLREFCKGKIDHCFRKLNRVALVTSEMVFAICTLLRVEMASEYSVELLWTQKNEDRQYQPKYLKDTQVGAKPHRNKSVDVILREPKAKKMRGSLQIMTAPYEADSQLAYFSRKKYVDLVISNDSDLIVFGAEKILFEMDHQLQGRLFCSEDLAGFCDFKLGKWDWNKFIIVCILCGCDYFQFGKRKKFHCVRREIERQTSLEYFLKRKLEIWEMKKQIQFIKAFLIYKYATVFDHLEGKCTALNEFPFDLRNEFRWRYHLERDSRKQTAIFDKIRIDLIFFNILFTLSEPLKFLGAQIRPKTLGRIVAGECHPYDYLPFARKCLKPNQINHVFYHLAFVKRRTTSTVLRLFYLRNNNFDVERALSEKDDFESDGGDEWREEVKTRERAVAGASRRPRSCRLAKSKYAAKFNRILMKLRRKE